MDFPLFCAIFNFTSQNAYAILNSNQMLHTCGFFACGVHFCEANMVDFTIKNLEIFVTVVDRSSFSQAANDLYLSQSTVSSAISALEKSLGALLLVRNARRKVEMTEAGERLYPMAKRIIGSCAELQETFRQGRGFPPLLIGASSVPARYLLPGLMAGFLKKQPDCRYIVEQSDSRKVHQMLKKEIVRIGFTGDRVEDAELTYLPVAKDRLVVVTQPSDRMRQLWAAGTYGRQLLDEPIVTREEGSGTHQAFVRYLQRIGLAAENLHVVARLDSTEAIKELVAQGAGIAVLSSLTVTREVEHGELLAFELDEQAVEREIYMVCRRDWHFSELEQQFISWIWNTDEK